MLPGDIIPLQNLSLLQTPPRPLACSTTNFFKKMNSKTRKGFSFGNFLRIPLEHPILFIVIIFFIKGIDRITSADLYAEEATVFLQQALTNPVSTLFSPYGGYFHTLPRIVAITSTFLPLEATPYFFNIVCFLIAGLVFSTITNDEYQWLIHKKNHRILVALLFCMLPGLPEIAGNLTNLHWILLLWLGLLGIKDLSYRYTSFEYLIILTIFSEGACIIFLPLFVARVIAHMKDREKSLLIQEFFVIAAIILSSTINYFVKVDESSLQPGLIHFVLWVTSIFKFVVLFPILGGSLVFAVAKNHILLLLLPLAIISMMVLGYHRQFERRHLLFFIFLLCGSMMTPLIAMARIPSIPFLMNHGNFNMSWYDHRYSFFGPAIGYLLWFFAGQFLLLKGKNISTYLFCIIFIVAVAGSWNRYFIHAYGKRHDWSQKTKKISSCLKTGHPREVLVCIYPEGWIMEIRAKEKSHVK